jgi:hypothetical protein
VNRWHSASAGRQTNQRNDLWGLAPAHAAGLGDTGKARSIQDLPFTYGNSTAIILFGTFPTAILVSSFFEAASSTDTESEPAFDT